MALYNASEISLRFSRHDWAIETRPIVDVSSPHGLVNGLVLTVDPGTKDQGTQGPEN